MREIRFRAWDKKRMRFHWGTSNVCLTLSGRLMWQFGNDSPDLLSLEEIENYTLLQYTGLKDKNGQGIYEGDIILIHHKHPEWKGKESKWQVVTEETPWGYDFSWEHISGYDCSTHVMEDDPCNYEVIGNIYENPELLKENNEK